MSPELHLSQWQTFEAQLTTNTNKITHGLAMCPMLLWSLRSRKPCFQHLFIYFLWRGVLNGGSEGSINDNTSER